MELDGLFVKRCQFVLRPMTGIAEFSGPCHNV